jgi:hypothetical protein
MNQLLSTGNIYLSQTRTQAFLSTFHPCSVAHQSALILHRQLRLTVSFVRKRALKQWRNRDAVKTKGVMHHRKGQRDFTRQRGVCRALFHCLYVIPPEAVLSMG